MSFTWFRKHEKTFLWITVAFTIVIFALFSSMGDLDRAFSSGGASADSLAGSFTTATSGSTVEVDQQTFLSTRQNYVRFMKMMGGGSTPDVEDEDIWAHLITLSDAEDAGLVVSDAELGSALGQLIPGGSKDLYQQVVARSGFATARAFEGFFRTVMMAQRWREARYRSASVLPAEDVYQRWRVDNELFDLDAVIFEDLDPESIESPGPATLLAWYEELPEFSRNSLFKEPAKHDIAFAYLPFDVDPDELIASLDESVAAAVAEPSDTDILQRFVRVKNQRYEGLDAPDDETKQLLARELKVLALAAGAHSEYRLLSEEERSLEGFTASMEKFGLGFVNPEGLLGAEEVEALEHIGDDILPLRLRQMRKTGDSQIITSVTGLENAAAVVFLEAVIDERPLEFAEAGEQVLDEWRIKQAELAPRQFHDALKEAARNLPDVGGVLQLLETTATEAAELAIAAAEAAAAEVGPSEDGSVTIVDDARKDEIRAAELARVQGDIDNAVSEHLHQVWDSVIEGLGDAVERVQYTGVPRNYRSSLTADERDPLSMEQHVKTHFAVFQLDQDSVTDVLRLPAANASAVVLVAGRSYPEIDAMFADEEGMLAARTSQSSAAMMLMQDEFSAAGILESHGLLVAQPEEAADEEPGDAP